MVVSIIYKFFGWFFKFLIEKFIFNYYEIVMMFIYDEQGYREIKNIETINLKDLKENLFFSDDKETRKNLDKLLSLLDNLTFISSNEFITFYDQYNIFLLYIDEDGEEKRLRIPFYYIASDNILDLLFFKDNLIWIETSSFEKIRDEEISFIYSLNLNQSSNQEIEKILILYDGFQYIKELRDLSLNVFIKQAQLSLNDIFISKPALVQISNDITLQDLNNRITLNDQQQLEHILIRENIKNTNIGIEVIYVNKEAMIHEDLSLVIPNKIDYKEYHKPILTPLRKDLIKLFYRNYSFIYDLRDIILNNKLARPIIISPKNELIELIDYVVDHNKKEINGFMLEIQQFESRKNYSVIDLKQRKIYKYLNGSGELYLYGFWQGKLFGLYKKRDPLQNPFFFVAPLK